MVRMRAVRVRRNNTHLRVIGVTTGWAELIYTGVKWRGNTVKTLVGHDFNEIGFPKL